MTPDPNHIFDIPDEEPVNTLTTSALYTYPPTLAHDMACAMTSEEVEAIRLKYDFTPEDFEYILSRNDYKRDFTEWRQKLITEGNSFKLKLRAMAEEFLPQLHHIMNSDLTAPSVKTDAFKYIVKCSGLEPVKEEAGKGDNAPRITIEIANYAAPASPSTINITPSGTRPSDYCE